MHRGPEAVWGVGGDGGAMLCWQCGPPPRPRGSRRLEGGGGEEQPAWLL